MNEIVSSRNGFSLIKTEQGNYGIWDMDGNMIVPSFYDECMGFGGDTVTMVYYDESTRVRELTRYNLEEEREKILNKASSEGKQR